MSILLAGNRLTLLLRPGQLPILFHLPIVPMCSIGSMHLQEKSMPILVESHLPSRAFRDEYSHVWKMHTDVLPHNTDMTLQDALQNAQGRAHFNATQSVPPCSGSDFDFVPQHCAGRERKLRTFHIAKTQQYERLVEEAVERSSSPSRSHT